ncbi:MAG: aminodeoxychorismate/anthranilate synthase component II [Rickettsiales bacterium]|nr:aminodeoxychorismate/anthranilate synthase component II [Rickettsiales bacterium]
MILLIDNYDSFTYNLYHYFLESGADEVLVKRNDKITIDEIKKLKPQAIILSPGPCTPNESGVCLDVIKECKGIIPIFGVCLGHQAIGQIYGGKIVKTYPMHGKVSTVTHDGTSKLFKNIPNTFKVTRYHSLMIENHSIPADLKVTCKTDDGIIMAIEDHTNKVYGVQFHPESIASEYGHEIIKNFLDLGLK